MLAANFIHPQDYYSVYSQYTIVLKFLVDIYNLLIYTMRIDKIKGKEAWLQMQVARLLYLENAMSMRNVLKGAESNEG